MVFCPSRHNFLLCDPWLCSCEHSNLSSSFINARSFPWLAKHGLNISRRTPLRHLYPEWQSLTMVQQDNTVYSQPFNAKARVNEVWQSVPAAKKSQVSVTKLTLWSWQLSGILHRRSLRSIPTFQRCLLPSLLIALMMETLHTCGRNFYENTRCCILEGVILILAALRTWNLTKLHIVYVV
jgi:hypothetical protein